jgi:chaperonin GroES
LEVKVGDIVMYGKWGGTEVKIDGKDIVIMKESDVMGIVIK